jgi:hypothetical protein
LNQLLILSKTIFSLMIMIIFKIEQILFLNKSKTILRINHNNKINLLVNKFQMQLKETATIIKIEEVIYLLRKLEPELMLISSSL